METQIPVVLGLAGRSREGGLSTNKTKTKPTKNQTMLSHGILADVHLDDPEPPRRG